MNRPSSLRVIRTSSPAGALRRQPTQVRTGCWAAIAAFAVISAVFRTFVRVDRRRVRLGLSLRFALDVDPPAGKARREPRVLTLFADCQRQRLVGHNHFGGAGLFVDAHLAHHLGRRQGVGDELGRDVAEIGTMSIFSPRNSLTTWRTRAPRAPTHAPTGSTLGSLDATAILVRCPAREHTPGSRRHRQRSRELQVRTAA